MLQHIKSWFLRSSLLIAVLLTVALAILSLVNTSSFPTRELNISDKILHSVAYFVLILSWLLVFRKKDSISFKLILFLVLVVFGIILELLQGSMMQHRSADWRDVLANVVGLLVGLATFKFMYRSLLKA